MGEDIYYGLSDYTLGVIKIKFIKETKKYYKVKVLNKNNLNHETLIKKEWFDNNFFREKRSAISHYKNFIKDSIHQKRIEYEKNVNLLQQKIDNADKDFNEL